MQGLRAHASSLPPLLRSLTPTACSFTPLLFPPRARSPRSPRQFAHHSRPSLAREPPEIIAGVTWGQVEVIDDVDGHGPVLTLRKGEICVLLRLADPPPDDPRAAAADREAFGAGSRLRRRRAAATHAVVRTADGSEGLCPVRMIRRRQLVAGRGQDDAYAIRLRPHERAALEPPSAEAIAAATTMAFGDGRPARPASKDNHALSEMEEGAECIDDGVLAMEEEMASAAKAAMAEKTRRISQEAIAREQRDAAQSASAAAKEAAAAISSIKSAAGVWPTAPNRDAESDASSDREHRFSSAAGRYPQNHNRRRSLLSTRSRLYAEDAAATIELMPANFEETRVSAGCNDFEPTTIASSKSIQFKTYNSGAQGLERGEGDTDSRSRPNDNPISRDENDCSISNASCLGGTSEDDFNHREAEPRGVGGGDGRSDGEGSVRQAFVELSHQPLGQMFDRRRRGLARSGRPRHKSQLESDDSDKFAEQAMSVPSWVAAAASVVAGHTSDSDAASRRSASRGVGRVDLRAGRREARRAASAVATASLGHFSPVPGDSRPGSGALAEVASAVMSNGERAEVQRLHAAGNHAGTAGSLPYIPGTGEGAKDDNGVAVPNAKKKRSTRSRVKSNDNNAADIPPTNPSTSMPPLVRTDEHQSLAPVLAGFQDISAGTLSRDAASEYGAPPTIAAATLAGPASKANRPELTAPSVAVTSGPPGPVVTVPSGGAVETADAAEVAEAVQKQILSGGGGDLEALLAYVRSGRL